MFTKQQNRQPGKFEGNESQHVARVLHAVCGLGGHTDELGDVEGFGWYGLIEGRCHSFIVHEDNFGFFDYAVYDDQDEARDAWATLEDEYCEYCDTLSLDDPARVRIQRTVQLDPEKVRETIANATHQADALFALYRMAFPEWDEIARIEGWPSVNDYTWREIARAFMALDQLRHPEVLAGGMWANSGFSGGEDADNWQIIVDCEVTLKKTAQNESEYYTSAVDGNY